jgi:AcrR family transcriptional regulator
LQTGARSVIISNMSLHPKYLPSQRRRRISYLTEDEKIWGAAGVAVAHEHTRRPKTLARMRRIRRIAAILFSEGGLNGISLQDVAREAKVAPGSMQYYYSKRERLLHDVLLHHMQELMKVVEASFERHNEKNAPEAWLRDLTEGLLRAVTTAERPGHRVLVHTLHTLPDIERDDIEYRLRSIRFAITLPLSRIGGLDWSDERLEALGQAYLGMLSHAAVWFPQVKPTATGDLDALPPELEAHASLLVAMGLAGLTTLRAPIPS